MPSALDRLRARYDELDATRAEHLFVNVRHGVTDEDESGPDATGLILEYRELDWERNREIDDKYRGKSDSRSHLNSCAEKLAISCVDVWVRDDETGQALKAIDGEEYIGRYLPGLGLEEGSVGVARAAQALGRAATDGITGIFALMGRQNGPDRDWEIDRHMRMLGLFEPGAPSPEVGNTFMGESSRPTGTEHSLTA